MARRKCAIESAESGSLRDAADLTRAAISEHGEIAGILGTLGYGIPALPVTYRSPSALPEVAAVLEDHDGRPGLARTIVPVEESARALRWGLTLGVCPIQIKTIPATEHDAPGWARATRTIEVWDPRWLRFQWASNTWHLMTTRGEICIEDHPDQFALFTPYGKKKPWDLSTWKFLSLYYVISRDTLFDEARHSAVNAPVRVAKNTKGYTEPQRKKMGRLMAEMIRNNWIVLPSEGDDFEFKSSPAGDMSAVYGNLAGRCIRGVEIGLTGQIKTTGDGAAGFSKGDIHERIATSFKTFYASAWAMFQSKHPLRLWAQDCVGPQVGVDVIYDTESPSEKEARAAALAQLGDGLVKLRNGLDSFGVDLEEGSLPALLAKHGLRVTKKPGSVQVTKMDLAPTDVAKAIRVDEVRVNQGLAPVGGALGATFLSEVGATAAAPPTVAP